MDFILDAIQAGFGFGLGLVMAAGVTVSLCVIIAVIIGGCQRRHQ